MALVTPLQGVILSLMTLPYQLSISVVSLFLSSLNLYLEGVVRYCSMHTETRVINIHKETDSFPSPSQLIHWCKSNKSPGGNIMHRYHLFPWIPYSADFFGNNFDKENFKCKKSNLSQVPTPTVSILQTLTADTKPYCKCTDKLSPGLKALSCAVS